MKKFWRRLVAWLRFKWMDMRGRIIRWNGCMPKAQPCPKHKQWCQRTGKDRGGAWYWCPKCRDGFFIMHPQVRRQLKARGAIT